MINKVLDINNAYWVCQECGQKHGKHNARMSTWHKGKCNICKKRKDVTAFRDFGHSKYD